MIGIQFGLELKPGHSWHADIGDQTRSIVLLAGIQEILGRREREGKKTRRLEQTLQRAPEWFIVINYGNQLRISFSSHLSTRIFLASDNTIMSLDRIANAFL